MLPLALREARVRRDFKLLKTGRESDDGCGCSACTQLYSVSVSVRVRSSTETVGFGLLGDRYQSQFFGL